MKPETVIGWHRAGFRLYWRWRSRPRGGRPKITDEIRVLIRRLAEENSDWVAPSMKQFPPALRDRVRHDIALYKTFVRPMLPTARVYHHTPVVPNTEAGSWVVLEHASPDRATAYAGIFRVAAAQDDYYVFRPRGLDPARTYKVTYDNSGASVVRAGDVLQEQGVRVHVGQALRSELLLFETQ